MYTDNNLNESFAAGDLWPIDDNLTATNDTLGARKAGNLRMVYLTIPPVFILLCLMAILNNVKILCSIPYIRRPLSVTLWISLSLSLADTITASLMAASLIVSSFLPNAVKIEISNDCLPIIIEALRLSGILTSTAHILLLATTHYLGIIFPFRSKRWLTGKNFFWILTLTWLAPFFFIFSYFSITPGQALRHPQCHLDEKHNFLVYSPFRTIFSVMFFIPLVAMVFIYSHITIIVRRHQRTRRWYNRHAKPPEDGRDNRNIDRNLKAIWTSGLILSTYIICFIPAVLQFCLLCEDCYYTFERVDVKIVVLISCVNNFLLILKYFLNPLIYAARMQEIKAANKLMIAAWKRRLCCCRRQNQEREPERLQLQERPQRASVLSGTSRRANLVLNSLMRSATSSRERPNRRVETTSL